MREYDCYLFDVDGTLIDTTELIYRCFVHTCSVFGQGPVSPETVQKHIGLTLRTQLAVYLGPQSPEKMEEIVAEHMRYQLSIYRDYLRLFPGVKEGLAELKGRGKRMAIVSSRFRSSLDLYLSELGVFDFFDVLVTPESTQKHKPDPEPALRALDLLQCPADRALFVGDAEFDILCGARAGMDTAFVLWSRNDPTTLPISPTYLISEMVQLRSRGGV